MDDNVVRVVVRSVRGCSYSPLKSMSNTGAPFDFGNVERYRSHLAPRDGLPCMPEITDFFNVAANPSRGA